MPRRRRRGPCEYCGERGYLGTYRIVFSGGDDGRNVVRLCPACLSLAPKLRRDVLRLIAHEREDRVYADAMGHESYERNAHGAMERRRDG